MSSPNKPKKWHWDLEEELESRDSFCRIKRGPNYVYNRPKENPYLLSGMDEFLSKYPFEKKYSLLDVNKRAEGYAKSQCLFIPPDMKPPMDVNKRFYPQVNNKDMCNQIRGFWSPATNRSYRYGRGVCWKRKEDAECAAYEEVDLLRPGTTPEQQATALARGKATCNSNPKCKWVKMRTSHDCFSKAALEKKATAIVESPPVDMPKDITTEGVEQYLYDWYVDGKKGVAPATSPLIGEGNRCRSSVAGVGRKEGEIIIENENEPLEEDSAPGVLPTMPQSIINMILKNIIAKDSTNKGILAVHSTGSGKCHAKDTPILMYDGSIKMVQDVVVGDLLMGDDSTPRRVLSLASGEDEMYDIIPTKGEKYTVNSEHILCLKHTFKESVSFVKNQKHVQYKAAHIDNKTVKLVAKSFKTKGEAISYMKSFNEEDKIVEIEVKDYLKLPKHTKRCLKGYRKGVDFTQKEVHFDPYIIGVWLGDGTSSRAEITCQDARILHYLRSELKKYNLNLSFQSGYSYNIVSDTKSRKNTFLEVLRKYNLVNNKHIPDNYKLNDRKTRLAVLAGLIDTDGYLHTNCYEIIQKSKQLSDDIVYLARTLGFAAYQKQCTKSCMYKGEKVSGVYYKVSISGAGLHEIPVKVLRKQAFKRMQIKDALVTGIKVEHIGRGHYYGFTLDGNNRYLLGDFTVTHNTCTAAGVMEAFWDTKRDIIFATSLDALAANPPVNFMECLYNMYPRFQRAPYKQPTKEASLGVIASAFERRGIRFLSFAKLANRVEKSLGVKGGQRNKNKKKKTLQLKPKVRIVVPQKEKAIEKKSKPSNKPPSKPPTKSAVTSKSSYKPAAKPEKPSIKIHSEDYIDLNNTILIIDEVHNLFRPLATQRKQHDYLKKQLIDPTKFPGLKVVILTATPGDNVEDVMNLLNIVRDPTKPAIKPPNVDDAADLQMFRDSIRGLVSFFDLSGDRTRFPIVKDNSPRLFPMSDTQFSKYIEAYKKTVSEKKATDYDALAKANQLNKYWAPARKYSNMLYGYNNQSMEEFSAKMPGLLETISAFPNEKHYVYSAFYENREKGWGSHGILTIAKFLEKELGYTKLTVKEAQALAARGEVPSTKARRYILVTQNELGDKGEEAGKLGKQAGMNLKALIKTFNHPENRYGEYVGVMLASQGFNEGIDLKAVRHIHIFEPLLTMASDKQTIGRAARFCSHADLDHLKGEWTVQVHRYMSDLPLGTNAVMAAPTVVPGLTPVEQDQKTRLENDIAQAQRRIVELQEAKPKKGSSEAEQVAKLKAEIAEHKTSLKNIAKAVEARDKAIKRNTRKRKTLDATGIENIDKFIHNEARNRFKQILGIYETMKEAAIDCQVLKKFHGSTGRIVRCAYEKENSSGYKPSPYPAFRPTTN